MQDNLSIFQASQCLSDGGVIAYPTEGVFGLGCDPFNQQAVERILTIKQRPVEKGVILIAANLAQLIPYLAELSAAQTAKLEQSWPGPFTWVVPHNGTLPVWITGGRDNVAVRVSGHPLARDLCAQFQSPIVSTSANRAGDPALCDVEDVRKDLGAEVDYIVEGQVQRPGQASQITDLISGLTFRA